MKMIGLIAIREYMENVRTKGFWIGILIFPVIFIAIYFIQTTLADSTPTRFFVLVDQSGDYEDAVESAIEIEHQRRILQEFVSYLLENRIETDLEQTAAIDTNSATDQIIDSFDSDESAALTEWIDSGGLDFARTMASPYLKPDAPPFEQPEQQFIQAPLPPEVDASASAEEIVEQLRPYLSGDNQLTVGGESGELFALIFIPEDINEAINRPGAMPSPDPTAGVQYWAKNLTDSRLPDAIRQSINNEIRAAEYDRLAIDRQQVSTVQRTGLALRRLDPTAEAGEEAVSVADTFRQFAPVGFVYLMFISLMQNVQYLLSNTIEEKSNRIIEVLLASVTADELMMGKLVGIGMAGLTTIAAWILSFLLFVSLYESSETEAISQILEVLMGSDLIPWFVFYYFAGYALYSGIFLAIGSLCNTLKEAQALMTPMIMIQVVPIMVMAFVVLDPNNTMFRAMSWFPLFTPYLMMNRAAANPPMIDMVGTTLLLIVSIVIVTWGAGKVFKLGVLRTGQPPKLVELFRLLRSGN